MAAAHRAAGHFGVENTLRRAQQAVFFPQMRTIAEEIIAGCAECVQKLRKQQPQRHTLASYPSGNPFWRISVDIVGP